MKLYLKTVQNILATQDYLTFDRLLTNIYREVEGGKVEVLGSDEEIIKILNNFQEVEEWKKKMIEIYGLFGFI